MDRVRETGKPIGQSHDPPSPDLSVAPQLKWPRPPMGRPPHDPPPRNLQCAGPGGAVVGWAACTAAPSMVVSLAAAGGTWRAAVGGILLVTRAGCTSAHLH